MEGLNQLLLIVAWLCFMHRIVIVIIIVNSKLLKRHSKAKRRAPAYSRVLKGIKVKLMLVYMPW